MFLTNLTTRVTALTSLTLLFAGTASATRVNYGDQTRCTYYEVCQEVCEPPDEFGNVYCAYACDSYAYCVDNGFEELPSSEEECDFDADNFFDCFLQ